MKTADRSRFLINAAYFIFISALIFLIYKYLLSFLLPFIVAIVIGFFVQKPSIKISKRLKVNSRTVASVLAILVYFLCGSAVVLIVYFLFSNLQPTIKGIAESVTSAADTITALFNKYSDFTNNLPSEISSMLNNLPKMLADNAVGFLTSSVSSVATFATKNIPSFFFSFLITVMASIYFARDFKAVKHFAFSLLPEKYHKNVFKIKNIMFANVFKMIKGYAILILITFAELCIGFLTANVKNAVFLAAVISVIDALPVLGVGVALIPWAVISIISGKIGFGIYLAVLYLIIAIVRNVLEPKILSSKLGIPPLLSLLIIFCGLKLFGFFGMIVAFISLVIFIDFYREQ